MGAGGVVPEWTEVVTREQAALLRLVLVCVAWAIGQMLAKGVPLPGADFLVPAALAAGTYLFTHDIGRAHAEASARYWRGRRIDDDRRDRNRWN
jgi:hypothetical protein